MLVASRFGARLIDLASLIILARLLTPADFGLVAVAMSVVQVVEAVLEVPIGQALVFLLRLTPKHLDTAFTLGLSRSLLVAAILALCAWPAARIYGDDHLFLLIIVLSLSPALRGLMSPAMAEYARRIDFGRDLALEVIGKVTSLIVAVTAAYLGEGYWAIAMGTVSTPLVMCVLSYILAPYMPRLSLSHWREFLPVLGWTSATQFVQALNWQYDRLLIGHFASRQGMGEYTMADNLAALPDQGIVKPVMRPLSSAFTHVRHDRQRLADAYRQSVTVLFTACLPVMLGLSLLADPAVRLVLGGKWLAAVPYLHWLALVYIPPLLTAPLGSFALTVHKSSAPFYMQLLELTLKVPALYVVLVWEGIPGVIGLRLALAIVLMVVGMMVVKSIVGLSLRAQAQACSRPFAGGIVFGTFLLLTRDLLDPLAGWALAVGLVATGTVALCLYVATVFVLWSAAGRPSGLERSAANLVSRKAGALARRLSQSMPG
jgi:O-antigen/teichoic acid export membrane protein